ncbi:hypothetical protein [Ochrobactrum soli]|nr:hypothetical protein [[Ochrobactrum] soli]
MQKHLLLVFSTLHLLLVTTFSSVADDFRINSENCSLERSFASDVANRLDTLVLRKFHAILMDNELSAGCGSLQFTDAKMDSHTNGFSFGLSQFDLATRSTSVSILKDIIRCARDEGFRKITPDDIKFLDDYGHKPTFVLKDDEKAWSRFGILRGPIEETLRSHCGRTLIANSYIAEMKAFERQVAPLWTAVLTNNPSQKSAELFYKLYALDLLNVLGGADGFRKVVAGEADYVCFMLCAEKITALYRLDGPVSVGDFIRYPFQSTCYGFVPAQTRQQDALRRLDRVLQEVDIAALPLDSDDMKFLKTDFAVLVGRNMARFPGARVGNIQTLIARAGGRVSLNVPQLDEPLIIKSIATCSMKS